MRRLLLVSTLVVAAATTLAAPVMAQPVPRGDIAMSYSWLYDSSLSNDTLGMSGVFPAGWLFSASGHVAGPFSLVGEIGANYQSLDIYGVEVTIDLHSYLGGVRYAPTLGSRVRPFVQVLAGLGRLSASTGVSGDAGNAFVSQFGGGADIMATKKVALRLQGDYRALRGDGTSWSEFRFATGVVYKF